jgi:benzoyl-CoA 2,3-dioxygenase component B
LSALNETLRDDYIVDCRKGVERWNRTLSDVGTELRLPHVGFNRSVGTFAGRHVSPDGRLLTAADWTVAGYLPTVDDKAHVASLMIAVREPGKMAGWLAPPSTGIHQQPTDFEYVRV